MAAQFHLVTLDSAATEDIAAFWCAAIGLHESSREDEGRWIVLSDDTSTERIGIQRGVCRPGSVHLDLQCGEDEFETEVARLLALGATLQRPARTEPYGMIANLTDPDGNAFDLCAYH